MAAPVASELHSSLRSKPGVSEPGARPAPPAIAVAIPCYNEEASIRTVVADFKRVFPDAQILVFDNNSTDRSAAVAREAGAIVCPVHRQGKGNVMRSVLETVHCDALIVVDGDDTYSADEAPMLLDPVLAGKADMVVGDRLKKADDEALVKSHRWGNRLIVGLINFLFSTRYEDILSGYRVLSRRFIESIPLLTPGFETETELTLQCLEEGLDVIELPISYRPRPENSQSKLRLYRDGWRIVVTAAMIMRDHKPLRLYGSLALLAGFVASVSGVLRLLSYTGVPYLSNSLLAALVILFSLTALILMGIGLTLSAVNTRLSEIKQ
ncbi:MAG TPA: glycosyltransferase family 2 protein, partial [Verrucomicrobiae bacterium]|nr:glycosyltransferase family 2 protein [Verrucomicrobiae bacterium]